MRRQVSLGLVLVCCLAFFVCANTAWGQAVFGSIIGTVTDPQGNAVAGAKVTVTSVTKSFTYDTTTNESGNYTVTHLIPDNYKIHIEAPGFKAIDVPSVVVSADTAANVDEQLQVGAVTQTVEVTGEIPQLQTDRADIDVQFSQKYIEDLPVLDRNFTSFELLSPGTLKLPGFNHAATENPQGGGQIQVNGQHFSGTGFQLDGTDNQDPILGIIVVNPNLDAIAETKIALQDFDAEQGKAIAGSIGVQIKSGSNEFHGTGFYYYRNSDQQAKDPFLNTPVGGAPIAPATWKQYGGSIGGPIIKDKLFFFGDYQGTRQIQGISNLYTIPTATVLKTCNPATNTTGTCDLSEYLNAFGPPVGGVDSGQIFQPGTYVANGSLTCPNSPTAAQMAAANLAGACRAPFVNNQIPIGMIATGAGGKPGIGGVLNEFPTPTSSGVFNNFVSTGSGPYNQYSFDTRVDYSAPHNFQVFGRFSLDYFTLSGLGGLGALGGTGFGPGGLNGSSIVHNYSLASGFTKAIGTYWLTDFRVGWFQYHPLTHYSDANQTPMTAFGFPGLNLGTADTGGTSGFLFSGNGSPSNFGDGLNIGRCNCPLDERERQIQFVNNWTRTQGNHTFKFGADVRYATNLRIPSDNSRTGLLSFDAGGTSNGGAEGLSLATFLLGDVTQFQRFVSPPNVQAVGHQWRTFYYGQDSWRMTPKLTLTAGLRWEIYFPEAVTAKNNAGFADLNNGTLLIAGNGSVSDSGNVRNTLKAFAPRMSLAYQLDSKTVLRLGYGRSFDLGVFGSNFGHAVTQNLPVLANQQIQDSNLNSAATNNRTAVFNLNAGPPAYPFTQVLGDIGAGTPQGTLPLFGPDGTSNPYIRPTIQRLPTVDEWNATVQRQLTPTLNLTVSYIGNKGTHVFAGTGPSYNVNEVAVGSGNNLVTCKIQPVPAGGCPAGDAVLAGFNPSVPANNRRKFFLNGVPSFTYLGSTFFNPILGINQPTPACCPTDVNNYFGNDANNEYDALQIKVEKRLSWGLQFLGHYTFSHAYAYDSTYYSVDPKVAYGPNPFNRNQVVVVNAIYELPVGRGKKFFSDAGRAMDLLVGGWQISNTTTYGTGLPWTPSIGECSEVTDAGPCRPNIMNGQQLSVGKRSAPCPPPQAGNCVYWFTPTAALSYGAQVSPANLNVDSCTFARPTSGPFALPACGQIGNLGFDSYRGPHAFYDDAALTKRFNITERYKAEFRFDAYNLFNHPVLALPGNQCIDCGGNAGQITDIEADSAPGAPIGMRQLQFGFRFIF